MEEMIITASGTTKHVDKAASRPMTVAISSGNLTRVMNTKKKVITKT